MSTDNMIEAVKRISMVTDQLEEHLQQLGQKQQALTQALAQTINDAKQSHQQSLNEAKTQMKEQAHQVLKEALDGELTAVEKRLNSATDKVEASIQSYTQERVKTAAQTRILTWKAVSMIGVTFALLHYCLAAAALFFGKICSELNKLEFKQSRKKHWLRSIFALAVKSLVLSWIKTAHAGANKGNICCLRINVDDSL